jgi:CRISPR-associated protein (TIGR03986 family)
MITAPYNFVPLNKEVFYPSWSDEVSHDVPFEDAQSGEIEVNIRAISPIFVRDSKDESMFSHHNNREFIPSSSIKGVIRNILEIISYSKIDISDKQLSYRDLNHPSYKKKAMNGAKIHMGWLVKKGKNWLIDDLGTVSSSNMSRIKYSQMQEYLSSDIVKNIRFKREAYEKYQVIKDRSKLDIDIGTIVFTGTVGKKKTREFLFPKKIKNSFVVSSSVVETFKQAYYIGKVDENKNWKNLWSKELRSGNKIPIFFQLNQQNEIAHFGLSMLYKLPYENSTLDLVKNHQDYDENRADLSETIFGFVKKDKALKGRVQFSHFMIDNKVELNKKVTLPISSPRSTFFPSYIEQNEVNGKTKKYQTYDDKNAVLRGFKLYPPQKNAILFNKLC